MRFLYISPKRWKRLAMTAFGLLILCGAAVLFAPQPESQTANITEELLDFVETGGNPDSGKVSLILMLDEYSNTDALNSVVATLSDKNLQATFMLTGRFAEQHSDMVKTLAASGHELGVLGWSSTSPVNLGAGEFVEDLKKTKTLLMDLSAQTLVYFSPPFAALNDDVIKAAQSCELKVMLPDSAAAVWQNEKSTSIEKRAAAAQAGDWFCLYVNPQCAEVLPEVLNQFSYQKLSVCPAKENS